ncbi:MAG: type III pantothenate kinase [Desulfovibrio sp.]|nr:type III pantothenate kinase [Desulfovibrio sp.]
MQPRILLFDIGNTSVKIGLANENSVLTSYALRTQAGQTSDDFGLSLLRLLAHAGVQPIQIAACAASSVVPDFDPLLRTSVARYLGCPLVRVGKELFVPLENRYARPQEVGADRLVGAFAARRLYPETPSLLVVDFGTAMTIDCVARNAYEGGLIFPGPATALDALARQAAKLPRIDLDAGGENLMPGRDTVTSIRHGLIYGFACMVEGLTQRLRKQLPEPVNILGTGGFAPTIASVSTVFDAVLPSLLLEGLRRLYYEHKDGREIARPEEQRLCVRHTKTSPQGQKECRS